MSTLKKNSMQDALETIEKLPMEQQETLVEIVKRRLVERRRDEIAQNAKVTLKAVTEKKAKFGNVEELEKDLLGD